MFYSIQRVQAVRVLAAIHKAQWLLAQDPARITEHLERMRAENPVFTELVCEELTRRRSHEGHDNPTD